MADDCCYSGTAGTQRGILGITGDSVGEKLGLIVLDSLCGTNNTNGNRII